MVRKTITRLLAIITASSLLLCMMSASVAAAGLGVGPSTLAITNAMRGAIYERAISVMNSDTKEGNFPLGATGEISGWVSFHDLKTPTKTLESLFIAGKATSSVLVRFAVPEDAASKTYNGNLYVETPVSEEVAQQMGNVVKLQVPVGVTIEVTGTQVMQGAVTKVAAKDTEVGLPLRTEISFSNTGNVAVQPSIKIKILLSDKAVAEITHTKTSVNAGVNQTIAVEWDTTGRETGDYSAQVEVSLGGKVLDTKSITFKLLSQGVLSREGRLVKLGYEGQPAVGTVMKIQATFANAGQASTRAKLVAEVYRQGNLVDTIQSEELLVTAGKEETLTAYFKPGQSGEYQIKGHVNYEGQKTQAEDLLVRVGGDASRGGQSSSTIILIVAAAVVILGAVGYMLLTRRKHA